MATSRDLLTLEENSSRQSLPLHLCGELPPMHIPIFSKQKQKQQQNKNKNKKKRGGGGGGEEEKMELFFERQGQRKRIRDVNKTYL